MTEDEVNISCKHWIESQKFKYKGVLNTKPKTEYEPNGYGQVPVPDGNRQVLLDHQGIKDSPIDLIWIEAKGSDVGMSQLLEGFTRMAYAVYHGGGKGLLAVPSNEFNQMKEQVGFLKAIGVASERQLGLLDAETMVVHWL